MQSWNYVDTMIGGVHIHIFAFPDGFLLYAYAFQKNFIGQNGIYEYSPPNYRASFGLVFMLRLSSVIQTIFTGRDIRYAILQEFHVG